MKNFVWLVCALVISCSAVAREAPERDIDHVRFNAFAIGDDQARLIARGQAGQSPDKVRVALDQYANEICPQARVIGTVQESEYKELTSPYHVLAQDQSNLLGETRYHELKRSTALTAAIECKQALAMRLAQPALKVFVQNDLGEAIPYFDQGFASFNRERLDVPIDGTAIAETLAMSVKTALNSRGYQPTMVDSADQADIVVSVAKARVPQEQFDGIALMTKIGLLGLTNLSGEFCSVVVIVQRKDRSDTRYAVGANIRKLTKPVYTNWKTDMAGGPPAALHKQTSAALSAILNDAVDGAVHRFPPAAFEGVTPAASRADSN
ncbi:hypothetical protein [Massilia sp. CF038]|uniref:hypothetical protein n=1 Tax=Massilia sp. CF038 TaxID=1881045 RepID=UPI00091E341A|nr:hypothetical protein [Massilia sp. CF038]SHH22933.1 hypothetical protein SAMN05428948_3418 [Massilia sp. CF038]